MRQGQSACWSFPLKHLLFRHKRKSGMLTSPKSILVELTRVARLGSFLPGVIIPQYIADMFLLASEDCSAHQSEVQSIIQ
jgi:hypothetical protein